jgi:HEAT repeat protein
VLKWDRPEFLEPLLAAAGDGDLSTRESALEALGNRSGPQVVDTLVAAVEAKESALWHAAIEGLAKQSDPRAVALLRRILEDPTRDEERRRSSAVELGRKGRKADLEVLSAVLKDRSQPTRVRGGAAWGLGLSKDRSYAEPLTILAADTTDHRWVRREMLSVITWLEGQDAVKRLLPMVRAEADSVEVRCYAAMHVVRLTDGKIDDADFVWIITHGYVVVDGYDRDQKHAVRKLAQNGLTEDVRRVATAQLVAWGASDEYIQDRADAGY